MSASPYIDQLAAQARERSSSLPPATVEKIVEYVEGAVRSDLGTAVGEEHVGAVLLLASGLVLALAAEFQLNQIGISNSLAIAGERLYHRTSPFIRKEP